MQIPTTAMSTYVTDHQARRLAEARRSNLLRSRRRPGRSRPAAAPAPVAIPATSPAPALSPAPAC